MFLSGSSSGVYLFLILSAWIGEDQLWPYVEFKEKYMIMQRAPQGFKEAVDTIEDVLRTRQGGISSKVKLGQLFIQCTTDLFFSPS